MKEEEMDKLFQWQVKTTTFEPEFHTNSVNVGDVKVKVISEVTLIAFCIHKLIEGVILC